jgi:hypothetical protein
MRIVLGLEVGVRVLRLVASAAWLVKHFTMISKMYMGQSGYESAAGLTTLMRAHVHVAFGRGERC